MPLYSHQNTPSLFMFTFKLNINLLSKRVYNEINTSLMQAFYIESEKNKQKTLLSHHMQSKCIVFHRRYLYFVTRRTSLLCGERQKIEHRFCIYSSETIV